MSCQVDIPAVLSRLTARCVDVHSAVELEQRLTRAAAEGRSLRVKFGADPSRPDLHLGHVVGLNKLREFQDLGHTVVFIIGDFTARIGDPSGKSKTRPQLTASEVQACAQTYQEQVFRVLDRERTEIRFNSEWFESMPFDEVIRLAARVTVAQMLQRDDFSKRHAESQPISLVEFLYPLIQAYDSVMVEADIELGGTDQLFNLLLGRELQRDFGQIPQVVLTMPLLEGLDGVQKMSKSLENCIGITDSPGDMFGRFMSVSDEMMLRYARLVLLMSEDEIESLQRKHPHPRMQKDLLAQQLVGRFYGVEAAREASEEFSRVFAARELPSEIPTYRVPPEALNPDGSIGLLHLTTMAGLTASNGEARRLVQQGAVQIDGIKEADPRRMLIPKAGMVIRAGKLKFVQIQ